jgi:DNA-binding Lrp family transcriptional regulator
VKLGEAYERGLVRAHVLVTAEPKLAPRVVAELSSIGAVRTLHSVSGSFDLIAVVEAPSIEELDHLLDRIGALDGVDRTMSSIILSTRIDR